MAATVVWSQEALDDIDAIADYISRDSPHHVQRVIEALFELSDTLAAFPRAGRGVPELANASVHECFLYSYRMIYEIHVERIDILAVIHGRRLLESVQDRFQ
jgi:plasmid stabilization system protein ParE